MTPRLSRGATVELERRLDELFNRLLTRLLGGSFSGKHMFIQTDPLLSIPGLFGQAVSSEGGTIDVDLLNNMAQVVAHIVDKQRAEAKAVTARRIQAILEDVHAGRIEPENFRNHLESELTDTWARITSSVERITNTESQHALTMGLREGLTQMNTVRGIEDPVVIFVPKKDNALCDECRRIHLLDDGVTPRCWLSSEVSSDYHKRGEPNPSWHLMHPHCRCLWDGNAPVITEAGVKSLKKVVVGDLVLTHTGKFKKVLATFGREGRAAPSEAVYRIEFRSPDGKLRKLRVTNDHLMLTGQGWVRADKLRSGDALSYLFSACEACGESFPHDIQHPDRRFCSIQCVGTSRVGKPGPRVGCVQSAGGYSFRPVTVERVVVVRPVKKSKLARLYDITVEGDASFVVMGVVSHNCSLATILPGFGLDGNGRVTYIRDGFLEYDYQQVTGGSGGVDARRAWRE